MTTRLFFPRLEFLFTNNRCTIQSTAQGCWFCLNHFRLNRCCCRHRLFCDRRNRFDDRLRFRRSDFANYSRRLHDRFDNGFRNCLDNHLRDHLDRHRLNHSRLSHNRLGRLNGFVLSRRLHHRLYNCRNFWRITLDQNTLLANLNLHSTRTSVRICRLDFGSLLAGQGNFVFRLIFAMRTAKIFEQTGLILIGQRIAATGLTDTSTHQLLKQRLLRHFEFNSKLRNSCCGHDFLPPAHSNQ